MSWFGRLGLGRRTAASSSRAAGGPGENDPKTVKNRPKKILSKDAEAQVDKLRGMWTVYTNMRAERDRLIQLHKMIPLFLKLYQDSDMGLISDTFGDTKKFTGVISRRLVKEIRADWKASDPPEANSVAVMKLLSTSDPKDVERHGSELLQVLELVMVGAFNVEVATEIAIPSTLVKVLMLLFSLPATAAKKYDKAKTETRIVKLLVYMCNFRYALVELLKTDALVLIFHMTTLECAPHREMLRESMLGVASTILKYHVDEETVSYLSKRSSVKYQMMNLKKQIKDVPADQMHLIWSCFAETLRESSKVSGVLLDEFQESGGYGALLDTFISLEEQYLNAKAKESETCNADLLLHRIMQLMDLCVDLSYTGYTDIEPPASLSPYNNPIPETIGSGDSSTRVRNLHPIQVLQNFFLQSQDVTIRMRILDSILGVYAAHYLNFVLLQNLHTLAHFIEAFERLPFELKDGVLRVLTFVVTVVSYVPFQEISSLSCLLSGSPSSSTVVLIFQTVTKLVNFDTNYRKIFQEAGLLHMLLALLKRYYAALTTIDEERRTMSFVLTSEEKSGDDADSVNQCTVTSAEHLPPTVATYTVVMDCISLLLEGQPENVRIFRDADCTEILFSLFYNQETRPAALRVMQVLLREDYVNSSGDMNGIIEILQASPSTNFDMKKAILNMLRRSFSSDDRVKDLFRENGGFVCFVSLLVALEQRETSDGMTNDRTEAEIATQVSLIEALFAAITSAITRHEKNRVFFREQIVVTLGEVLKLSGILATPHGLKAMVMESLMNIATEGGGGLSDPEDVEILNPEVMRVILELFPVTLQEIQIATLKRVVRITQSRKRNQDALCGISLLEFIEDHLHDEMTNQSCPLHPLMVSFFEVLAMHRITTVEVQKFLQLLKPPETTLRGMESPPASSQLLCSLLRVMHNGIDPPNVEFDMRRTGTASVHLPSFGSRSWPPANGYTFMCWLFFCTPLTAGSTASAEVDLFSFEADEQRSIASMIIVGGKVVFRTSRKKASDAEFIFPFESGRWYHLGLVHSRFRFQGSEAKLYVDGICRGTAKAPFVTSANGNVSGFLGTSPHKRSSCDLVWKMGPCHLIEEVFTPERILTCFCLGKTYCGNFQGPFHAYHTFETVNSKTLSIVRRLFDSTSFLGPLDLRAAQFRVPEERIIFALNGYNTYKIAESENSVAKALSFREATPSGKGDEGGVVIMNAADSSPDNASSRAFLTGDSISLAASGIAYVMERVGSVDVVLMLMEWAHTQEHLLHSFSILVELLQGNARATRQMEWTRGYEKAAYILGCKSGLLSEPVLQKVMELIGLYVVPTFSASSTDPSVTVPVVSNPLAFRHLIGNYDVWKNTPVSLQLRLFSYLQAGLMNNPQADFNVYQFRRLNLLPRLLLMLQDDTLDGAVLEPIVHIICGIASQDLTEEDLHHMSTFLVTTLDREAETPHAPPPTPSLNRKTRSKRLRSFSGMKKGNNGGRDGGRLVKVRDLILRVIFDLFCAANDYKMFFKIITPNWLFFFIDANISPSSLLIAMKMLVALLQAGRGSFANRFRQLEGFILLEKLLPQYYAETELYYTLFCLLLGKPVDDVSRRELTFSDMFTFFKSPTRKIECPEALRAILCILKRCCEGSSPSSTHTYVNRNIPGVSDFHAKKELSSALHTTLAPSVTSDSGESASSGSVVLSESDDTERVKSADFGTTLIRWHISDHELSIQQAVIPFIVHLFHSSSELQEIFFSEKDGELTEYVVSALFPYGHLNFPPSDRSGETDQDICLCHRSSFLLFSFLKDLLHTAMIASSRAPNVQEVVSQAVPINVSEAQFVLYQSKMLSDLIGELKAKVTRRLYQDSSRFSTNLGRFCTFLVDKVCFGLFPHGGKMAFDFIIEILEKIEDPEAKNTLSLSIGLGSGGRNTAAKRSPKAGSDISMIYGALNRLIIHLLGVPYGKTRDDFLYIIQKIIFHQRVILTLNGDQEFFQSLCYVLYKFLLDDNRMLREGSMNVWKLLLLTKADVMSDILIHKTNKGGSSGGETIDLLTGGFDMLLRKDFSQFSYWLTDAVQKIHTVFDEHLSKAFLANKSAERKGQIEHLKHLKSRRAHRLHKKERHNKRVVAQAAKVVEWREQTITLVHEKAIERIRKWRQDGQERRKFAASLWQKSKKQLFRERGVWGVTKPSDLDKWKLDLTEGPFRMRKKLKRNYKFFLHYPFVPEQSRSDDDADDPDGATVIKAKKSEDNLEKIPTSYDSKTYWDRYGDPNNSVHLRMMGYVATQPKRATSPRRRSNTASLSLALPPSSTPMTANSADAVSPHSPTSPGSPKTPEPSASPQDTGKQRSWSEYMEEVVGEELDSDDKELDNALSTSSLTASDSESDWEDEEGGSDKLEDDETEEDFLDDDLEDGMEDKLMRILDAGDSVQMMYNGGRVEGQDKREGLFIIGVRYMYFVDDYELSASTGDIVEVERMKTNAFGEPLPESLTEQIKHTVHKWSFDDCKDVLNRRYLLQPVAIEVFSNDGRNQFLVFSSAEDRDAIYKELTHCIKSSSEATEAIAGAQSGSFDLPDSGGRLEAVRQMMWKSKETMCERWMKGEISNFQYLMYINTLAGRSYNDLTQYPVFPWVLADYVSEELDLTDPGVYRDLSKPMGALDNVRSKEFQFRFDNWEPDENLGVPKFHYGTHYSSAGHVLYYMIRLEPFSQQFLMLQSGRFDVADRLFHSINETWMSASGATQNLADVKELIPEFFYLPEMFMNSNKFEFGRKQSGERIDSVELPPWAKGDAHEFVRLNRQALESDYVSLHLHQWIDLIFGFKQQGAEAAKALNVFYYLTYEGAVDIDSMADPIQRESTIAQINNFGQTPTQLFKKPHPRREVCFCTHPCPAINANQICRLKPPSVLDLFASPNLRHTMVREEPEAVCYLRSIGDRLIVAGSTTRLLPSKHYNKFISWGHMDFTVRIRATESATAADYIAILESPHEGQVNCLCATEDGRFVVTGGADSLVAVHRLFDNDQRDKCRFATSSKRLCGHGAAVSCCAVSRSYSIIVTGGLDRTCIVWDLNRLEYVRQLQLPGKGGELPISDVYIDDLSGNIIVVAGPYISIWSVNGMLMASRRSSSEVTSITCSQGLDYLDECCAYVTGHKDGTVAVWRWGWEGRSRDIKLKDHFKAHACPVSALHITSDQRVMYSGGTDGRVVEWAEDFSL